MLTTYEFSIHFNSPLQNCSFIQNYLLLVYTTMEKPLFYCYYFFFFHDIKYNSKKSAVLVCKSKYTINAEVPSFKTNGEIIKEFDHIKYLGHFICNTLRDDKDILRQCRQLYARSNMLLRKCYMCCTEVGLIILSVHPCIGLLLWRNYTVASIHTLKVVYNNIFRKLLRLPKYCSAYTMFVENCVHNS